MRSGSHDRRSISPRYSRESRRTSRSPIRERGYGRHDDRDRGYDDRRGGERRRDDRDRDYGGGRRDSFRDRGSRRGNGYGGDRDRYRRRHNDGRENPRPSNTLGIFGMSLNTSEKDLREIFERYGRVESVKVIMEHGSDRSRGFGFITFEDTSAASKARDRVADTVIDGMKVRVDFAVERRRTPPPRDRSPIRRRYSRSPSR